MRPALCVLLAAVYLVAWECSGSSELTPAVDSKGQGNNDEGTTATDTPEKVVTPEKVSEIPSAEVAGDSVQDSHTSTVAEPKPVSVTGGQDSASAGHDLSSTHQGTSATSGNPATSHALVSKPVLAVQTATPGAESQKTSNNEVSGIDSEGKALTVNVVSTGQHSEGPGASLQGAKLELPSVEVRHPDRNQQEEIALTVEQTPSSPGNDPKMSQRDTALDGSPDNVNPLQQANTGPKAAKYLIALKNDGQTSKPAGETTVMKTLPTPTDTRAMAQTLPQDPRDTTVPHVVTKSNVDPATLSTRAGGPPTNVSPTNAEDKVEMTTTTEIFTDIDPIPAPKVSSTIPTIPLRTVSNALPLHHSVDKTDFSLCSSSLFALAALATLAVAAAAPAH